MLWHAAGGRRELVDERRRIDERVSRWGCRDSCVDERGKVAEPGRVALELSKPLRNFARRLRHVEEWPR